VRRGVVNIEAGPKRHKGAMGVPSPQAAAQAPHIST
jgi:hypothetical protein